MPDNGPELKIPDPPDSWQIVYPDTPTGVIMESDWMTVSLVGDDE